MFFSQTAFFHILIQLSECLNYIGKLNRSPAKFGWNWSEKRRCFVCPVDPISSRDSTTFENPFKIFSIFTEIRSRHLSLEVTRHLLSHVEREFIIIKHPQISPSSILVHIRKSLWKKPCLMLQPHRNKLRNISLKEWMKFI